jgi:DNA-binding MarR family transcriptional regulator
MSHMGDLEGADRHGGPSERADDADYDVLEQSVGRILRQSRSPRFADAIRQRAGIRLDRAHYSVLVRLGSLAPVRLSDLAQDLGVDVSTVSRQVQSLEQKGLVDRGPDPDDGRAVRLELTRKGKAVMRKMQAAWQETIAGVLVDWKPDDIREFAALLARFASDLESFEEVDDI